jgi:phosphatidylethanolamine-binding protein (PEBP) family uncharacterized protein
MAVLVLSVAIVGCGGTNAPSVDRSPEIAFRSPALTAGRVIPSSLRCDEKGIWLPLSWGPVPSNTQELVLYIARYGSPVRKADGEVSAGLIAQSLVVGLKPTLRGLATGRLPHGALIGFYGAGSSRTPICPRKGGAADLLFRLYALSGKQHIGAGPTNANLLTVLNQQALAAGTFTASYART